MHRNGFFLSLLVLVALSFFYFAVTAVRGVYFYSHLSERKEAEVSSVEIEKVKSNQFRLVVSYFFKIEREAGRNSSLEREGQGHDKKNVEKSLTVEESPLCQGRVLQGGIIENKGTFGSYPNHYVAEKEAKKWVETGKMMLWFNPNNPLQATFERHFPLKSVISAFVLLAVELYLILLGRYVRERAKEG